MRKRVAICGLLTILVAPALLGGAHAAGSGVVLQEAVFDLEDRPSLQRGAKLFVNYCLSCHAASFMRYNRMGKDIGITEDQLKENLMFAAEKVGSTMEVALHPDDARRWFGNPPPDLSVISRARGPDWLYTYLIGFYEDKNPARPFGVNNLVFKDVAMPHVLAGLQGIQVRKADEADGHGGPRRVSEMLELKSEGSMNPAEYRRAVRDLVNFMVYLGEPAKLERYRIGFWVLVFLVVLYLLSRSLYKEYWKDVH